MSSSPGTSTPRGGSTTSDRQQAQPLLSSSDYENLSDEELLRDIPPVREWIKKFSPWMETKLFLLTSEGGLDLDALRMLEPWKYYFELNPYAKDIEKRSDECKVRLAERDNQPSEAEQTQQQPAVPAVPPAVSDEVEPGFIQTMRDKGVFTDTDQVPAVTTKPTPAVIPTDVVPPESTPRTSKSLVDRFYDRFGVTPTS